MIAWGVGVNNYYYSLDNGQTWTQRTIPETPPDYFYFYSVKWSDSLSLLVAVGSNHYDPIGQIFYSVDGLAWTQATINSNIERFNVVEWSDVQSKFVAIGVTPFSSSYNYSFTSADGKTWDRTNIPTIGQAIKSLIWVSYLGLWIAGCYQYGIYYSSDGDQWTAATGIMPGIAICWSQELKICLAVGVPADKRYATSKDGKNWILNTTTEYGSFDCAWSKKLSKFFVVGYQVSFLYSGDISENIIQFLSSNSTFYSLLPGTNVLSFQSGGGIFNGSVTYRNRYIGV